MVKLYGICLSLLSVLIVVEIALAGSKHGFAPIDERDLSFYLQTQVKENDPFLYLFSTLSLISRRKDMVVFAISKSSSASALPLVTMDIYPELHMYLQAEFFDVTIWGQWGNYFNKSVEMIELENEVLRIVNALNDLNERYKDLIQKTNSVISPPRRLPTLDRKNYVSSNEESDKDQPSKSPKSSQYAASKYNDRQGKIERYETREQQEKLKLNPALQKPPPEVFKQRSSATAFVGVTGASSGPSNASSLEVDNVFTRIFQGFASFMKYLINHKIETCIYFYGLLLLGAFVKVLLQR